MMKQEAIRIQYMLKKLRNPLKLKLPPNVTAGTLATDPGATASTTGATVAATAAALGGGLTANAGAVTAAALGSVARSSSTPVTTPVNLHSSTDIVEEKPVEKSTEKASTDSQDTTKK